MSNIYLCGNTGIVNRGCEAIIRSTVKILNRSNGDITLTTFAPEQDRGLCSELGINMQEYNTYPSKLVKHFCALKRKINKKSLSGQSIIQSRLFGSLNKGDICLNIGGDTYCYSTPKTNLALNKFTDKNGIDNILWCCSIEPNVIKGEILKDLKRYKYIFARDILTYNALIENGIAKEKVVKCCDPAFFLDLQQVELPLGFIKGSTVGINVSPIAVSESNPEAYKNVIELVKNILKKTDMGICLIPHVYSIKGAKQDFGVLRRIQTEINDERVSIVDKEYNCEQLKYIISKCRFFVGARTHSTIASYSNCIPTLVIGYSIKSKGIATDLFGTYEGYVLPYNELTDKNELSKAFDAFIIA